MTGKRYNFALQDQINGYTLFLCCVGRSYGFDRDLGNSTKRGLTIGV
jgi:hypothetical protein